MILSEIRQIYNEMLKLFGSMEAVADNLWISVDTLEYYLAHDYCSSNLKLRASEFIDIKEIKSLDEQVKALLEDENSPLDDFEKAAEIYYEGEEYRKYLDVQLKVIGRVIESDKYKTYFIIHRCLEVSKEIRNREYRLRFEIQQLKMWLLEGELKKIERFIKNVWRRKYINYCNKLDMADLCYYTGYFHYMRDEYDKARYYFKKSIECNPLKYEIECRIKTAVTHKKDGNIDEASLIYNELLKKNLTNSHRLIVLNNYAELQRSIGNIEATLKLLDEADSFMDDKTSLIRIYFECTRIQCYGEERDWCKVEKAFNRLDDVASYEKYILQVMENICKTLVFKEDKIEFMKIAEKCVLKKEKFRSIHIHIKALLYDMMK